MRRHRRKDGAEIAGSTLRNLRNDIKHLKEAFGDVKLAELTEELVTEWYYGRIRTGNGSSARNASG